MGSRFDGYIGREQFPLANARTQELFRFRRFGIQVLGKLWVKRFIMSGGRPVVSTTGQDLYHLPVPGS